MIPPAFIALDITLPDRLNPYFRHRDVGSKSVLDLAVRMKVRLIREYLGLQHISAFTSGQDTSEAVFAS